MLKYQNKLYITLYLTSIGISITNIIQTGLALSTGRFIELNPIGYNWFLFLLITILYLFLLVPLFIKDKSYKAMFLIVIIYLVFLNIGVCIHDIIVININ